MNDTADAADTAVNAEPVGLAAERHLDPTRPHYLVRVWYGGVNALEWEAPTFKFATDVDKLSLSFLDAGRDAPFNHGERAVMVVYGPEEARDFEGDRQRVSFEMRLSKLDRTWMPQGMSFFGYGPRLSDMGCPFSLDPVEWDNRPRPNTDAAPLVSVRWDIWLRYDPDQFFIEPDSAALSGFQAVTR